MALPDSDCTREFTRFIESPTRPGKSSVEVINSEIVQVAKRIAVFNGGFLNGGSPDMNVDGSITPVEFTAGPTTTNETWLVTRMSIEMDDNGTQNFGDFGAIVGGLTNGLVFQQILDSTTYSVANIQTNSDLVAAFEDVFRGQGNSFISDANYVALKIKFYRPIELNESTNDIFKLIVRDNLTGLSLLRAKIGYIRIIE